MIKNVDIDVVISTHLLMRDMFIAIRDNGAYGGMIPDVKTIIDVLDGIIYCLKEMKEEKYKCRQTTLNTRIDIM